MAESLSEQPYYLLHTLVGATDRNFSKIMSSNNREWPVSPFKMDVFLEAQPETADGITEALGLDLREVMTTVSKASPASTYHWSYGLVLEGEVIGCFDNDTGKVLGDDGSYSEHVFDFTNPTTPEDLLGNWYEMFSETQRFTWNEAILAKGSRVIGAFYDPRHKPWHDRRASGKTEAQEYELFRDKISRCGLKVLEVSAKFGVNT